MKTSRMVIKLSPRQSRMEKSEVTTNEKWSAAVCHFMGIFLPVVPSLIFLLLVKSPFVKKHAKEAMVFQLITCAALFLSVLSMVFLIGFLLFPVLCVFAFVVTCIATVRALKGQSYRYPITSRWVK